MSYSPFRKIGRSLLAACAVSVVTACLSAQTAPSTTATGSPNPSRWDVSTLFSYMGSHGVVQPSGVKFDSVNLGVQGNVAYWFNKYVGAEGVFIGNPDGCPNGGCTGGDAFYAGYAGPIFRAPMQNFTLFAHALAGGVRGSGPNVNAAPPYSWEPWTWGPSVMAGGGMDYALPWFHNHFGIRLFEADYRFIHLDYGPGPTTTGVLGGRANLGAAELSSGIMFHFGSIVPPPPIVYACSVTAPTGTIYPGDQVTITGTATNVLPKRAPEYSWSGDGGAKSASNVVTVSFADAGTYTVKGHVSDDGSKLGRFADCSTTITVTPFAPPTVGCSANPAQVNIGDSSTITASGMSPQNRPLTYGYSSSAGSISGTTATTTLSTTGVAGGTVISVTCTATDDKGQSASQQTTVTVLQPPPPRVEPMHVVPTAKQLCTIAFNNDPKRPTRVDNEAKACLDDITLNAQRDPGATLAIVGNSAVRPAKTKAAQAAADRAAWRVAEERAWNEKVYLVQEKGVDASRISLYTGSSGANEDNTTLIPAGATFDTSSLKPVADRKMPIKRAPAKRTPAKKPATPTTK